MPFLRLYFNDQLQEQCELTANRTTIGRASDNDIQLQNPGVSKRHAYIECRGNTYVLHDNNSSNGVLVNNERVIAHTLRFRDEIQIYPYKLLFMPLPKLPGEEEGLERDLSGKLQDDATVAVPAASIATLMERQKSKRVAYLVYEGRNDPHILDTVNVTLGRRRDCDIRCGGWFAPRLAASIQRRHDGYYLIRGKRGQVFRNGAEIQDAVRLSDGDSLLVQGLQLTYRFAPIGGD